MKKRTFILMISALAVTTQSFSQNPFESLGAKDIKVLTFSNGKFNEFFDNDSIVQIGSVLFNTRSNEIVAFVEVDTTYSEATLKPEITSRWLSPDPLASKFPFISPYAYADNNPILYVDPDGREVTLHGSEAISTFTELQNTTSLRLSFDMNLKLSATIPEAPLVLSKLDVALLNSINDKGVNVNLYTTQDEWYSSKDGTGDYPIVIGGYEGSDIIGGKVETTQIFNLQMAKKVEAAGLDKSGNAAAHEILESYHGGKDDPGGSYGSGYSSAHQKATNDDSYKPNTTNYVGPPNPTSGTKDIGVTDGKTKVKLTDNSPSSKNNKFIK